MSNRGRRPRSPPAVLVGRGRWDVLVAAEQVGGVPAVLDGGQPLPGRPRVGLADAGGALVAEEVDVGALVVLLDGGGEPVDPGLADGPVVGALVEGGQVDHEGAVAGGGGGRP